MHAERNYLLLTSIISEVIYEKSIKILTEVSKTPRRAVALASYLGKEYSSLHRSPIVNDLMAFGSVLQHTQHTIGWYFFSTANAKNDFIEFHVFFCIFSQLSSIISIVFHYYLYF